MKRVALPSILAVLLLLGLAVPVGAAPPEGDCPRAFTEADPYTELLEIFPQVPEAFGEEAVLALLADFDNNGNGVVCWIAHPPHSTAFVSQVLVANVIDDNAAPHE